MLVLFASGDFAFNLYWQSAMVYLLFFYTEALHLPMYLASACYAFASAWDGVASLAVGLAISRIGSERGHRLTLAGCALPLGLSFVFAYAMPPFGSTDAVAWILAGHLCFRTFYALTNIPYLAMSARISASSGERTLVAGGRMVAGTLAGMTVALTTLPLGQTLTGSHGPPAYAAAAAVYAGVATVVLLLVAFLYRDAEVSQEPLAASVRLGLFSVWRNPAFAWLMVAMVAMVVAVTVLDRSVLYFFKYRFEDQARGQLTLGMMMAVSGVGVPLWLGLSRRIGLRGVWLGAVAVSLTALSCFILFDLVDETAVQSFLIVMQAASVGLSFVVWSLLPEAIGGDGRIGGARMEALAYGWSALLQRVAIGAGTILLGFGYDPGAVPGGGAWLRLSLGSIPLLFFLLSGLVMLVGPQGRRRAGSADEFEAS